ncbi:Ferredoxin-type protein NapH [Burkholderiales bacterium]|nr:Ferredoxin-type protein NapH [Burkholderiales bacterium]
MARPERPGAEATAARGWFGSHKWLVARRVSQLSILAAFLLGPLAGVWIVKGNLNFSYTLGVLPLADPYVLAQSVIAGHAPERKALIGAAIVLAVYFLVGGRAYCSWACPVNMVTDLAHWLRRRLGITKSVRIARSLRYWVLGATLVLAGATGTIAWELVNPVSMFHRGLIFGVGAAWTIVLAVFLLDLLFSDRGWCGRVCPVGAFYSLLALKSPLRVTAARRAHCNDCLDCYAVCPEKQVIKPALKGASRGAGAVILSPNCTNCGRCIDVCSKEVFRFGLRYDGREDAPSPALPGAVARAARADRA